MICTTWCELFLAPGVAYLLDNLKEFDAITKLLSFTKQNDTRNGKPHYFSIQQNMIYWTNSYWSYEEYDAYLKRFRFGQIYPSRFLSNGNGCKNTTQFFHFLGTVVKIKIRNLLWEIKKFHWVPICCIFTDTC